MVQIITSFRNEGGSKSLSDKAKKSAVKIREGKMTK